jgi:8-oxo-dGTP pyrophosphatase MutT (NUDIX family)
LSGTPTRLTDRLWRCGYRVAFRLMRWRWRLLPTRAAAAGVAIWHDDALLVLATSYHGRLCLPGGGLGVGEEARSGALRELREETGIAIDPTALGEPLHLRFVEDARTVDLAVFTWRPEHRPKPRVDGREIVHAAWLTRPELAVQRLSPGLAAYLERVPVAQPTAPM